MSKTIKRLVAGAFLAAAALGSASIGGDLTAYGNVRDRLPQCHERADCTGRTALDIVSIR